jgi:sec-independent protein translocase protein TatA
MLGDVGWQELLIVLVIIALLFGASRVADMGAALGKGVREFREGVKGTDEAAPEASLPVMNVSQAPTSGALPTATNALVDDIVRLTDLRDRGVLTDEQFEVAKAKLLETA